MDGSVSYFEAPYSGPDYGWQDSIGNMLNAFATQKAAIQDAELKRKSAIDQAMAQRGRLPAGMEDQYGAEPVDYSQMLNALKVQNYQSPQQEQLDKFARAIAFEYYYNNNGDVAGSQKIYNSILAGQPVDLQTKSSGGGGFPAKATMAGALGGASLGGKFGLPGAAIGGVAGGLAGMTLGNYFNKKKKQGQQTQNRRVGQYTLVE